MTAGMVEGERVTVMVEIGGLDLHVTDFPSRVGGIAVHVLGAVKTAEAGALGAGDGVGACAHSAAMTSIDRRI